MVAGMFAAHSLHLSVQDVARRTGLTAHTVRFYERRGLVPPVGRDRNGYRRYTDLDVEWLIFVSRLRASGMPITAVKRFVDLTLAGEHSIPERIALLREHEQLLLRRRQEVQAHLDLVQGKIKRYSVATDPSGPTLC